MQEIIAALVALGYLVVFFLVVLLSAGIVWMLWVFVYFFGYMAVDAMKDRYILIGIVVGCAVAALIYHFPN